MAPRKPIPKPIPSYPRPSPLFQFSNRLEPIVSLGLGLSSSLPSVPLTGVKDACRRVTCQCSADLACINHNCSSSAHKTTNSYMARIFATFRTKHQIKSCTANSWTSKNSIQRLDQICSRLI